MKFKKGDRVYCIELPTSQNMVHSGGWVSAMADIHLDMEFIVTLDSGSGWLSCSNPKIGTWSYDPKLFSLIKDKMTQYKNFQKELGIIVGDTVELTGIAQDGQFGWGGSWDNDLDGYLGDKLIVTDISEDRGYIVVIEDEVGDHDDIDDCDHYEVPFFCVEKVEGRTIEFIKVSDDYTAHISAEGVKVGCQRIDLETAIKVGEAAAKFLKK